VGRPPPEFRAALGLAAAYRGEVAARPCKPAAPYRAMLESFDEPLPERGSDGVDVIRDLARRGEPGLTPMTHPRFFGWVLGGSAPVGVAADWLVSAWGQNAAFHETSPTAAAVEEVAARWLLEILDLPRGAAVGFVTGATVATFTALAAARGAILRRHGWDPDRDGLFGAPPVSVFVGEDAHASVLAALGYLGFGRERVHRVETDPQGRICAEALARRLRPDSGPSVVIAQAGQINSGAFDPFRALVEIAGAAGAWLHVDGAFGLWARAHPAYRGLTDGADGADSWAVDGHKWLQTPFDSGYAIVRDRAALVAAMGVGASYLPAAEGDVRASAALAPELSRRARGVPTWAMLKALGREGVEEMVDRHCGVARRIAQRLAGAPGVRVLNAVVLNQVVVAFGDEREPVEARATATERMIAALRASGAMFVAGATWRGERVMRISVCCDATSREDADPVADAILSCWSGLSRPAPSLGASDG
jgi:glutamate/tyrosine decarboxylase-like PLP-dependent enzyme